MESVQGNEQVTYKDQADSCVGVFMMLDCYARLDRFVAERKGLTPVSKKKL
jgi:hypothetical protein